jgi:L,D-transpeptidase YcbB
MGLWMTAFVPALAQSIVSPAEAPVTATSTSSIDTPAPLAAPAQLPLAAPVPAPDNPVIAAVLSRLSAAAAPAAAVRAEDRAALTAFFVSPGRQPVWTTRDGLTPRGVAALAELKRAPDYGLDLAAPDLAEQAQFASVETQADAEARLGFAILAYARQARGGRVDPATVSRLIDMRPQPFEPKALLQSLAVSADVAAALRGLHPQHPGFQRLVAALAVNRTQPASPDAVQRIVVNMERWRWMPEDLGALYVWNNVPEQVTRVVKAGETVLTEKIVVGKPGSPTPTFSAAMRYVIFHPSWGVPEGIKANEIGPMLRRASASSTWLLGDNSRVTASLARHDLRVSRNGQEINPESVDWTKANVREFQFTQPPSGRNVLGVVKFRFPNRFDVYMHDTSERHLFSNPVRAYSHGCMRVQNPLKLAEILLAHDKGWPAEKVHGYAARNATADITLEKPVAVHITYFTASADENGKLQLHGDLYGWDQRVASALAGKPVTLPAPAVAASASPRQPVPRRTARTGATASSGSFSPFSGLSAN